MFPAWFANNVSSTIKPGKTVRRWDGGCENMDCRRQPFPCFCGGESMATGSSVTEKQGKSLAPCMAGSPKGKALGLNSFESWHEH